MKPESVCRDCSFNNKGKCKVGIGKTKEHIKECSEYEQISILNIQKRKDKCVK